MDKKTININPDDISDIFKYKHEEFALVEDNDTELVFKQKSTGDYYKVDLLYDDYSECYADGGRAIQVFPKEVTITVYE